MDAVLEYKPKRRSEIWANDILRKDKFNIDWGKYWILVSRQINYET